MTRVRIDNLLNHTALCMPSAACRNCERIRPAFTEHLTGTPSSFVTEIICRKAKNRRAQWSRKLDRDIAQGIVVVVDSSGVPV
jgi:hypothetical protein